MNKKKLNLALIALLIAFPVITFAWAPPTQPGQQNVDVGTIMGNVVDKVWIVFAGIALLLFIWAGVKFLTANGDASKIGEARTAALWGVVGVVIMILAFSIFSLAGNLIGGR